jgi:hypothetical protein
MGTFGQRSSRLLSPHFLIATMEMHMGGIFAVAIGSDLHLHSANPTAKPLSNRGRCSARHVWRLCRCRGPLFLGCGTHCSSSNSDCSIPILESKCHALNEGLILRFAVGYEPWHPEITCPQQVNWTWSGSWHLQSAVKWISMPQFSQWNRSPFFGGVRQITYRRVEEAQ